MHPYRIFIFAIFLAGFCIASDGDQEIEYVPSHEDSVRDMLSIAYVGKDDVVYDLGSGDGRIVISAVKDFDAKRAVGVEIKPELVKQSRQNAEKSGVGDRTEFLQQDLLKTDFSDATVVTLYLGHQPNIDLRPKLFRLLKPGSRVVSNQFGMGEWSAYRVLTTRHRPLGMRGRMVSHFSNTSEVPDYGNTSEGPDHVIQMWVIPAPVAGTWEGEFKTDEGRHKLRLVLQQLPSSVSGTLELQGKKPLSGRINGDVVGKKIRFYCFAKGADSSQVSISFKGRVDGDSISGALRHSSGDAWHTTTWAAKRKVEDYAGAWNWASPILQKPVQLKITKKDGKYSAVYSTETGETPITDFYDFGGGFYFTLKRAGTLVDNGTRVELSGWIIGHATMNQGSLSGQVSLYLDMLSLGSRGQFEDVKYKDTSIDWTPRKAAQ